MNVVMLPYKSQLVSNSGSKQKSRKIWLGISVRITNPLFLTPSTFV